MKKKNVKRKIKEFKVMLLCLNAYGSLSIEGVYMLEHYIDGLFKCKGKKRGDYE